MSRPSGSEWARRRTWRRSSSKGRRPMPGPTFTLSALSFMKWPRVEGRHPSRHPLCRRRSTALVKRCLEAAPDDRWQSARDLEWELRSVLTVSAAAPARPRYWLFGAALGLLALLLVGLAVVHFSEAPPRPEPVRMSILLPEKSRVRALAVSPDGRQIAMVLVKDGKQQIWVRALDAPEPAALAGTDGAGDPFWSPDSRFIGFFADAKLKKIDRSGGPVQILCDALAARGGTWNSTGDILFGGLSAVERVSESGGKVTELPGSPPRPFPGVPARRTPFPRGRGLRCRTTRRLAACHGLGRIPPGPCRFFEGRSRGRAAGQPCWCAPLHAAPEP